MTVTDEDTGERSEFSASKSAVGALPNDPPVVDAGPTTPAPRARVDLGGSVTDPDDTPTLLWTALGTGTDAGASCTFANAAAAVTSVTCTDDGTGPSPWPPTTGPTRRSPTASLSPRQRRPGRQRRGRPAGRRGRDREP